MTAQVRPIFTADWPFYAKAAHVLFWATSALFLAACVAAVLKALPAQIAIVLFFVWIISGSMLGAAAACSGKLYTGDRVFSRKPITGWPARIAGMLALLPTAALLILAYGLTQISH
jgi:hypothetical protein